MTPVSSTPTQKTEPTIDKKDIENLGQQTNLEISKVKSDVSSIKSMMNEINNCRRERYYNKRSRKRRYTKEI